MLRKIKLYSKLADFVGHKEFDAVCKNPAEAIRFLICNFPEVESHMAKQNYKVLVGDYEIDEKELHYPSGHEDIHIVPIVAGSGGNFGRVLGGAALIGLSFVTFGGSTLFAGGSGAGLLGGGGLIGTGGLYAAGAYGSAALGLMGAGLMLSGVSGMMTPQPKLPEFSSPEDPRLSFNFSGTQNTSRAGTPINIVFGEVFVGSIVVSAGVDTEQVRA